ncbi:hypothetical protein J6590_023940 [Homalodisca vitripennis]|nr:hypothetical protein J6590_023940 [Homalodisca vitripennis]
MLHSGCAGPPNRCIEDFHVEVSTHRSLCPAKGHFPYEGDCQRFYKCQLRVGRMQGTLYHCPQGYSFWDVSRRCEKSAQIPVCPRGA